MAKAKAALENPAKVPVRQWRKWSERAREVFNQVFAEMNDNQHLFLHPKAIENKPAHWNTTAFNAAWIAADAVDAVDGT